VLLAFVVAAFLTPDVVSMILMALPLMILYEISISARSCSPAESRGRRRYTEDRLTAAVFGALKKAGERH